MLTVGQLADETDLGLRIVAGHTGLGRAVSAAHATEWADPVPWLHGEEFLMTVGMTLEPDIDWLSYLQRLERANVAGLGLGVGPGLPYPEAPVEMRNAADSVGLPLVEIPRKTPFIAVTEAVYRNLATQKYRATERALQSQRRLTAAAVQGDGVAGLVDVLGELTGMWVVVADASGHLLACTPKGYENRPAQFENQVELLRKHGIHGSISVTEEQESFFLLPLGALAMRGYLACGTLTGSIDYYARAVAASASSLLTLEIERRHAVSLTEWGHRAQALRKIIDGTTPTRTRQLLEAHGIRSEQLKIAVLECDRETAETIDSLYEQCPDGLIDVRNRRIIILFKADTNDTQKRLANIPGVVRGGIGGLATAANITSSFRQATHAMAVSKARASGLIDAMQLDSLQLLLELGSPDTLATYADAVLGPIERATGRGQYDLILSLRTYLAADCSWEIAAKELHVHRNTLRQRIERIERLSGRRLTTLDDRVELLTALRARDIANTGRPEGP